MMPARSREHRAGWTSAATAASRLVTLAGTVLTIPATRAALDDGRFGLWMTLGSLLGVGLFLDLGLGNGLMTAIASASGAGAPGRVRGLIASAYAALITIAVAGAVIALTALTWAAPPGALAGETRMALAVFVAGMAAVLPLYGIQRVQLGLQQGWLFAGWEAAGGAVSIAAVIAAAHRHATLPVLVACWLGPLALAQLGNSLWFFGWRRPDLRPAAAAISRMDVRQLLGTGLLYSALQLAAIVTFMSDGVLLLRLSGPATAGDYLVGQRLFSLVGIAVGMFVLPYWPAYAEALASGNRAWMVAALRRTTWISVAAAAAASAALAAVHPWLLRAWLDAAPSLPWLAVGAFAVWNVMEASGRSLAMFFNAVSEVRFQVAVALALAAAALTLKLLWIPALGGSGAILGTVVAYGAINLPAQLLWLRRVVARVSGPAATR